MQALIAKAVGAFFVVLIVLGLTFHWGYSTRDKEAHREALAAENLHLKQLNEQRQVAQGELDEISQDWREKLAGTEKAVAGTVAKLRADGIRLRIELADATVRAVAGDGRSEPDGKAELSDRASEFLIGQAKRADDQIEALQETVRALQGRPDE